MIQLSVGLRNNRLDAIETTVGTAPLLQLRTGAPPANCAAADTGTLLAEIECPSDWASAASSGQKTLLGSWTVEAVATGIAAHFRIKNTAGSVTYIQGTITGIGGGGDLILDNPSIVETQEVTISSFTINEANP